MPRRLDDIPIRPLFGIPDTEIATQDNKRQAKGSTNTSTKRSSKKSIASKKCSESRADMASYSEIPFLSKYPGKVPAQELQAEEQASTSRQAAAELQDFDKHMDGTSSSEEEELRVKARPKSLNCDSSFPYELEQGSNSTEGDEMKHFVAQNMEDKLRSANASHSSTPCNSTAGGSKLLTQHFLQSQRPPQIDANVLGDIEIEAQYLATSVDNMIENLGNLLHSISSITADNVEVHKNAVNKLTDIMDANIKCMYTIMAKTEEITKSMKPTEQLAVKIREIKRMVDMLDGIM